MIKTPRFALFLAVLAAILACSPQRARAEAAEDVDGGFYAEATATLRLVQTPHYNPFWNRGAVLNASRVHQSRSLLDNYLQAPEIGVAVGKALSGGHFIEVRSGFFSCDDSMETILRPEDSYPQVGYFPIDGSSGSRGSASPANVTLDFSLRETRVELLAGKTYRSDMAVVTPYGGLWGMHLGQTYELEYYLPASGDHFHLRDNVETSYGGLLAGVRLTPMELDTLTLELTLGAGMARSSYHAQMDHSADGHMEVTQDKTDFAGRVQARLTKSLTLGRSWRLGLTAGGEYLSYVPEVVASGGSSNEEGEYAHIIGADTLNGSLGLELRYSF